MVTFRAQCPHCNAKDNIFCFGFSNYIIETNASSGDTGQDRKFVRVNGKQVELIRFSLAGVCQDCKQPILATCRASMAQFEELKKCCKTDMDTRIKVEVLEVFPQPIPPYSHAALPEEVNKAFVDLQLMIQEKKRPHFIITGCRTVLERAVFELGGEGDTLARRVENLFEKGIITSSLQDWASIIRRHGNEAAHEMIGTAEEATELVNFTKVFLQFTFELPATIEAQRMSEN